SAESLRIEREEILQPQNRVGEQATNQTEQEHGKRVLLPIVFLVWIDTSQPIGRGFERPQNRIEPCSAVCIEHLQQIQAQGLGNQRKRCEEESELKPAVQLHVKIFPDESWPGTDTRIATAR